MPYWADRGYAMRKREGIPTSHLESAGPSKSRSHSTYEEQYEMAKKANSPRVSLGDNQIDSPQELMSKKQNAPGKFAGKLMPKKNTQAQDPTAGGKVNKTNIPYERLGASYRVSVPFTPTVDPVAGPTMQSAKIVPSVQGRQNPDFRASSSELY